MKKYSQLYILILLCALSYSAYSFIYVDDRVLAQQCYTISKKIGKLAAIQVKSKCRNNAANAALGVSIAGPELIIRNYERAKMRLEEAINNLEYIERINCIKKSKLLSAKNEIIALNGQIVY